MTTSTTTKSTTSKADEVSTKLLKRAQEVSGKASDVEFALFLEFAQEVKKGALSIRGYKATLEAAKDKGATFATIAASHGEHLLTMESLSRIGGAPRKASTLYTTAVTMSKAMKAKKGESKNGLAREFAEKLAETSAKKPADQRAKDWEAVAKKFSQKKANQQGHHNEKAKSYRFDIDSIRALSRALNEETAKGEELGDEWAAALTELSEAVTARLEV